MFRHLAAGLALLGGCAMISGGFGSGCAAGFDAPSDINTLRVLSIVADDSYPAPGDTVTFKMTYYDGYAVDQGETPRPVQIVWLGGCFDPEGDQYFACYSQLAEVFAGVSTGNLDSEYVAAGIGLDTFELTIPEDIISRRPPPPSGPYAGVAFVFFAVCAGRLGPVGLEGDSEALSFPLGCFDFEGKRLGPESFIPGYTQVYSFDDGRKNENPTIDGIKLDGKTMSEDFEEIPKVKACALTEDERLASGCQAKKPEDECDIYEFKAIIPENVAEIDPSEEGADGETFREVVWVDYFADGGDIDSGIKLVSDAVEGYQSGFETEWIPPSEPGVYVIWAVVHDNRGGQNIVQRLVQVE